MNNITCQFCTRSTNSSILPPDWYQADLNLFICPDCIIPVMTPANSDSTNYKDEDDRMSMEYYQKFFNIPSDK